MNAEARSAKSDLLDLRNRYLRELVEMARDQAKAEQKLQDVFSLERAMAAVQPNKPEAYGAYKRAIDAILDYLDEVNHAVTDRELADNVAERGFRAPSPAARSIVLKSIASYISGEAGRKRKVIREENGLIGRGDWPSEKFH